ncbi:uncharacterized protein Z518_01088 [Rhinocladiella mackenziei CBS 650.93]|uniref:F-box domain-containing protein n=1 Tax=Rhinocladiella mackenziei CBS 650.93 TaxID=1442369 RepID=A0A0D2G5F1_9EURO|nr:uncharacterized protein Z518_01088 [Rhinocladiella mackenziei CBS 650.93]KIX10007.1 hypothetical protein Z518_01088 [Rhinocladiella mackenziei CBS 650.93]
MTERTHHTDESHLQHRYPPSKSASRLTNGDCSGLNNNAPDGKECPQIDISEQSQARIPASTSLLGFTSLMFNLEQQHNSMSAASSMNRSRGVRNQRDRQGPFLSVLPQDLHYHLATQYLDFDTLLALRQTCRTFHDLLTPDLIRRIRSKFIQKCLDNEAQQYREFRTIYPRQRFGHLWDLLYAAFDLRIIERPAQELRCYGCLEVKPLWCFVERMSNRGTGLGAKLAQDRMCKDCMRRYRDIEGQWWKENWVKKSDTVRKLSKGKRIRRWALEGRSLVNADEEIGVCSECGSCTFELWWGCATCFELEEKRRREEDLVDFDGVERKIAAMIDAWRIHREAKWRQRVGNRERRPRKWWAPRLGVTWGGSFSDRKAALVEWKDSKGHQKARQRSVGSKSATDSAWRAADLNPLPKSRRQVRCSSCWVPNCPRRAYILGLADEGPMPRDRWCHGCQVDYDQRQQRKEERRLEMSKNVDAGGIFSDQWNDGLGCLFDQS